MVITTQIQVSIQMTWLGGRYPDLGNASDWLKQIFLAARPVRILLPRSGQCTSSVWNNVFVPQTSVSGGTIILVASQNVSCFLRPTRDLHAYSASSKASRKDLSSLQASLDNPLNFKWVKFAAKKLFNKNFEQLFCIINLITTSQPLIF